MKPSKPKTKPKTRYPPDYLTWHMYHENYLKWMQQTNHPSLRDSNWYADKFRQELTFQKGSN